MTSLGFNLCYRKDADNIAGVSDAGVMARFNPTFRHRPLERGSLIGIRRRRDQALEPGANLVIRQRRCRLSAG
jgi:hypothetical protein